MHTLWCEQCNTSEPLLNPWAFQGMGEVPSLPHECRCSGCEDAFHGEDPEHCILPLLIPPSSVSLWCVSMGRRRASIAGIQACSQGSVFSSSWSSFCVFV